MKESRTIRTNNIVEALAQTIGALSPGLHGYLGRTYRFLRYCIAEIIGRLRGDDRRLFYINPDSVRYTISCDDPTLTGSSALHIGTVSGGDWDLDGCPFKEYGHVYTILKQKVEDRAEYENIREFQENLKIIDSGGAVDNCRTREEYYDRWSKIESLYRTVKKDGYKSQAELKNKDTLNEVRVQIGRNGDYLFEEGLHRLAVAQVLNLEHVPVIVSRRHKQWENLRRELINIVAARGFIHQCFNHPDLDIIPELYGKPEKQDFMYGAERWGFIVNSLPVRQGTVLDIGAYFGYFAHRLEDLGFQCYAVEPNRENLAVLQQYKKITGKRFTVWDKSIFEIEHFDFDIVLALNIFHHLVKKKHDYEELVEFLGRIKCKAMYFEPARNTEPNSYKNFSDDEFIDFVLGNSSLNNFSLLGRAKEQRNVYLLTP